VSGHSHHAPGRHAHYAPPPASGPPAALPQFAHIKRHWDPQAEVYGAKLLPGDYYVTTHGEMITTVLGSCVSACVRDVVRNIGGMNHFMLPLETGGRSEWSNDVSAATRYGNVAMERLINDLLKAGARRENLEFKLVGGGRVLAAMTDIGARNIEFVRDYMRTEGFRVSGEDLGDEFPRKVNYFPQTGRVRVKKLMNSRTETIAAREQSYMKQLDTAPKSGGVELF
jgi:chemotaxis protein CheD